MHLYDNEEAGNFLKRYAFLVPMLYCDSITDAMLKGLGQQKKSVQYNIFTSTLDVVFLYLLLPKYGMMGYFFSFLITHLINFGLSLRRLLKITGEHISPSLPLLSVIAALCAVWISSHLSAPALQTITYPILLGSMLTLLGIVSREDIRWLKGLIRKK